MAYHASSKANQNSMKNHEIHFGKNYPIENFQGGQALQPYYQNEVERGSNLDKLLMQFEETLSAILSLITNIFLEMIWNVLPYYIKFMEFLAKR